jgi:hypothetical protein
MRQWSGVRSQEPRPTGAQELFFSETRWRKVFGGLELLDWGGLNLSAALAVCQWSIVSCGAGGLGSCLYLLIAICGQKRARILGLAAEMREILERVGCGDAKGQLETGRCKCQASLEFD